MTCPCDEDWRVLTTLFPAGWQEAARSSGAVRRLRGFDSVDDLLRTLLLHVGSGYSLRETAVRAKAAGWAEVSDVALLKRLRGCGEWWRRLCVELLREQQGLIAHTPSMRIIDASVIREPGPTGSQWRLHYSMQLPSLECAFFELTPARGAGTGERLDRYPLEADEIVLADRAYIHPRALQWAAARKVSLVVRYNSGSTPLFDSRKRSWPLLPRVRKLAAAQVRQWRVHTPTSDGLLAGRLCAVAKSAEAAERARRRVLQEASRQQTQPRPQSLELAGYVLVWTNLAETTSAAEVLTLYRQRWQIELAFKRMKSLAALGHLPKHDPESSRAWLYGKLLMALLANKLGRCGRDISPWGYPLPQPSSQPVA